MSRKWRIVVFLGASIFSILLLSSGSTQEVQNKATNKAFYDHVDVGSDSQPKASIDGDGKGVFTTIVVGKRNVLDEIDQLKGKLFAAEMARPPIGAVVAYAGDQWPPFKEGNTPFAEDELPWMLCDGRLLTTDKFPELYRAIRTDNGNRGGGSGFFNLPDYRGYFLRGASGQTDRDPDRESRSHAVVGGNSKNRIGSVQDDAIKEHVHSMGRMVRIGEGRVPFGIKAMPDQEPNDLPDKYARNPNHQEFLTDQMVGKGFPPSSRTQLGSETRPKNVYVHWIIRVK